MERLKPRPKSFWQNKNILQPEPSIFGKKSLPGHPHTKPRLFIFFLSSILSMMVIGAADADNGTFRADNSVLIVHTEPRVDHPDDRASLKSKIVLVPADDQAIVIPESAFKAALKLKSNRSVDGSMRNRAIALASKANNPQSVGIEGEIVVTGEPQSFSGTIFIVLRNPIVDSIGRKVAGSDFYIAAIGLSGTSPWVGRSAKFSLNTGLSRGGICCGPSTVCVEVPGPDPCDPSIELCGGPDFGFTPIKPNIISERESNGLPAIGLQMFPSSTGLGPRPLGLKSFLLDSSLKGLTSNRIVIPKDVICVDPLKSFCDKAKPVCEPGDDGYTTDQGEGITVGGGSTGCHGGSSKTVYFHDVPPICTKIHGWDNLPPECGGYCENCGTGIDPVNTVPPGCEVQKFGPDSNLCKTPAELQAQAFTNNAQMNTKVCGNPAGCRGTRSICEPIGYNGIEMCTTCTDGQCEETIHKPEIDPTIAADSPASGGRGTCLCAGEEPTCYETGTGNACGAPAPNTNQPDKPNPSQTPPADAAPAKPAPTGPQTPTPGGAAPGGGGTGGTGGGTGGTGGGTGGTGGGTGGTGGGTGGTGGGTGGANPLDPPIADFFPGRPEAGDPVAIGEGSLHIDHTDLSFSGPVYPLEFRRGYTSRSSYRGVLGSNWVHNWEIFIQVLNSDNTPTWALPYCAGSSTQTTCLILHNGMDGLQLFFWDLGSQLFMPQAGSTDTITTATGGGWALRTAKGRVLLFNSQGHLSSIRDPFGNGFAITHEDTPTAQLYDFYCSPSALASNNETKHSQRCAVLAYMVGDGAKPPSGSVAWNFDSQLYPLPKNSPDLATRLNYAVQYFKHLLSLGSDVDNTYGVRRQRPTSVRDDLGRELSFVYNRPAPIQGSPGSSPTFDFVKMPEAELLKEVHGPAGTKVKFSFGRPNRYPTNLNELFLLKVVRQDSGSFADLQPSASRGFQFTYQWPGSVAPSYGQKEMAIVYDKYKSYFETFVGCVFKGVHCPGQFTPPRIAPGSPEALAVAQRNRYVSDVADNIIQIKRDGTIESETRHESSPQLWEFDRVTAQRYGSSRATQVPGKIPKDRATDHWQTTLPKIVLNYGSAGPGASQEDVTNTFLPQEIRDKYQLETPPLHIPPIARMPVIGDKGSTIKACSYELMDIRREELPGFQKTNPYYDPISQESHPDFSRSIYRTRLTCEQLAIAQLSDPTHNDLLSTVEPITDTAIATDHLALRILGRRRVVATNVNRICGWTQMVDRDGDIHYYGLNYRGQILVDAIKERISGLFRFSETLYNADGMVLQERRPSRKDQLLDSMPGSTIYTYDEIDPNGNNGWNDWLPVFWSRRTNLLRIDKYSVGEVVDEDEATGKFISSRGRYKRFTYEPLFNRVLSIEEGSLESVPSGIAKIVDVPKARIEYVFDYQELALSSNDLKPILDHFIPWGFNWLKKKMANGSFEYDLNAIQGWQLPLTFYNADLNGDSERGFPYGRLLFQRARGLPILTIRRSLTGGIPLVTRVVYAPNGQPSVIRQDDGAITSLEYYPIGSAGSTQAQVYGSNRMPTRNETAIGLGGLLGRVRTMVFPSSYSVAYGPPGVKPCPHLAGPYQWLLPTTCSSDLRKELEALGFPNETIESIMASKDPSSPSKWLEASFSYSAIGKPRYTWIDGSATHIIRDTDGRILRATDPLLTTTVNQYSAHGFLRKTTVTDSKGTIASEVLRDFDEEGKPVSECRAKKPGGCGSLGALNPPAGVVTTWSYWPEGSLSSTTDPEGLMTEYSYNELQSPVLVRTKASNSSSSLPKVERYDYDIDGRVIRAQYGQDSSNPTNPRLSTSLSYDGLGRTRSLSDTRGYEWQFAYSNRNLLTRYRRSDVPYGSITPTPHPSPSWETKLFHNDFGQLLRKEDNGVVTAEYVRTRGGLPISKRASGIGTSFVTYNLLGKPAWRKDASGNQQVWTTRGAHGPISSAQIEVDATGKALSTAVVEFLDVLGRPTEQVFFGSGEEERWNWKFNALGDVVETRDSALSLVRYERNLLGWVEQVLQRKTTGSNASFEKAVYQHNDRGQIKKIVDPAGQETDFGYDPFGSLAERKISGNPAVHLRRSYDQLGRISKELVGTSGLIYIYDSKGDPAKLEWIVGGKSLPMAEYQYDDLGRLIHSSDFNPALTWVGQPDRTVKHTMQYDTLGRVESDILQIGTQPARAVTSVWAVNSAGTWSRLLRYPNGTEWEERYDLIGRLTEKQRAGTSASSGRTAFNWMGSRYIGRAQQQTGILTPFKEQQRLDQFGRSSSWLYTGLDLDHAGRPINVSDGGEYCGVRWDVLACGRPLLSIEALRNKQGRMVSINEEFGQPVFDSNGSVLARAGLQDWQGFAYDQLGRLDRLWEQTGNANLVPPGLVSHHVNSSDIERIGVSSQKWQYHRESNVGGVRDIANIDTAAIRWSLAIPRGPGHQVRKVSLDGSLKSIDHDDAGRIRTHGRFRYVYDALSRLSAVENGAAQVQEAYVYDAEGRLVAVLPGAQTLPQSIFSYDGARMISASDGHQKTQWEAAWGPNIDQLIEWNDLASGNGRLIPLVDHRNSVVALWGLQPKRLTETAHYDVEGRIQLSDARGQTKCKERGTGTICPHPLGSPFGFVSAWRSSVSGLVYMRNRWYAKDLGEFISHDPEGYADSYNLYAYAAFDPVNKWDPTGATTDGFNQSQSQVGGKAAAMTGGWAREQFFGGMITQAGDMLAQHLMNGVVSGVGYSLFPSIYSSYRDNQILAGMGNSYSAAGGGGSGVLAAVNALNPLNSLLQSQHELNEQIGQGLFLASVGDRAGATSHLQSAGRRGTDTMVASVQLGATAAGGVGGFRNIAQAGGIGNFFRGLLRDVQGGRSVSPHTVTTTNTQLQQLEQSANRNLRWGAGDPTVMAGNALQGTQNTWSGFRNALVRETNRIDPGNIAPGTDIHHWQYPRSQYPQSVMDVENLFIADQPGSHASLHNALGGYNSMGQGGAWIGIAGAERGLRDMFIFWSTNKTTIQW